MLSVIRDVTEQKQAQTTLERYMADLQRSNAELDQFAAIASHDLQEPLRMITSYLQLLKLQYDDRLDATGREFLNFALDGADRMNLLIKGFLTYARVRTDESEFIEFSSEKALQSALSNLRGQLAESQAKITHDALPEVRGDETLFIRLLQNLLSNAMKFRGEAPPEIHITARRDGEEWLFAVSDNGIGIEQEDLDRIFGMFQRVHSGEAYLGTGIGLAICKKVVDYHRGRLWAESSIGKGTTFYFTIPAAPAVNGQSL